MDYAVLSGAVAAKAVKTAREKNNFSAETLSCYDKFIEESIVMKDFKTFKNAPYFLESSRIYDFYPDIVCDMLESVLYFENSPKKRFSRTAIEEISRRYPLFEIYKMLYLLKDATGAMRAL
jgi:electron transfer flavoprotein-quinone oxidoreductase